MINAGQLVTLAPSVRATAVDDTFIAQSRCRPRRAGDKICRRTRVVDNLVGGARDFHWCVCLRRNETENACPSPGMPPARPNKPTIRIVVPEKHSRKRILVAEA